MTNPLPPGTTSDYYARENARVIKALEERVRRLENGISATQLGFSSIEDSYVKVKDLQGHLKATLGKQPGGTYALTFEEGDPPPQPTQPGVIQHQLAIVVTWDGGFVGAERPANFQRVDVHVSETAGFEPDETTHRGTLLERGALSVVGDNDTKYIKLVAVTNGGTPGPASAEAQGLPLPADQIAAGIIAAEHLASDIILASNIILGQPPGAHVQLNQTGIIAFDEEQQETVNISSETGNALLTGTYQTAKEGGRWVINEGGTDFQTMRAYRPGDDTHFSEIVGFTDSQDRSAIWIQSSSQRTDGGRSILIVNEDEILQQWHAWPPDGNGPGILYSRVRAARNFMDAQAGFVDFKCDRRRTAEAGGFGARVGFTTLGSAAGETLPNSIIYYRMEEGTQRGCFFHPIGAIGSSVRFQDGAIHIMSKNHDAGTGHVDLHVFDLWSQTVHYVTLAGPSGRRGKDSIEDIHGDSSLSIIRRARSKKWRYRDSVGPTPADSRKTRAPDRERFGPVAEDLPEELRVSNPNDPIVPSVDLASMVGLLWDAVGKIADRLDAIEENCND